MKHLILPSLLISSAAMAHVTKDNQAYSECLKNHSNKQSCINEYPRRYKELIVDKYLTIKEHEKNSLCFYSNKLKDYPNAQIETLIGTLGVDIIDQHGMEDTQYYEFHYHANEMNKPSCENGTGVVLITDEIIATKYPTAPRFKKINTIQQFWISYERKDDSNSWKFWK